MYVHRENNSNIMRSFFAYDLFFFHRKMLSYAFVTHMLIYFLGLFEDFIIFLKIKCCRPMSSFDSLEKSNCKWNRKSLYSSWWYFHFAKIVLEDFDFRLEEKNRNMEWHFFDGDDNLFDIWIRFEVILFSILWKSLSLSIDIF